MPCCSPIFLGGTPEVRNHVSHEIRRDDDVEPLRIADLPHAERVEIRGVALDVGILLAAGLLEDLAEVSMGSDDVRLLDASDPGWSVQHRAFPALGPAAGQLEREAANALGAGLGDADRRLAPRTAFRGRHLVRLARVRVLGVLPHDDIVHEARRPHLRHLVVHFVNHARVEFHRAYIRKEIERDAIADDLGVAGQLRGGIRLAGGREDRLAVDVVTDGAQKNRVGISTLLEAAGRPFGAVLYVVVTATLDLFDIKNDALRFPNGVEDLHGLTRDLDPDAVAREKDEGIALFHAVFNLACSGANVPARLRIGSFAGLVPTRSIPRTWG
jgi:hypothetical protein